MKDRSGELTPKEIGKFFLWLNHRLHELHLLRGFAVDLMGEFTQDTAMAMEFAELCQWAVARLALLEKICAPDPEHDGHVRFHLEMEEEKNKDDNLQFMVEVEGFIDEAVGRLEKEIIEPMLDERLGALMKSARIGLINNILRGVSKKIRSDDDDETR